MMANFTQSINEDNWHLIKFTVTSTSVTITLDNDDSTRSSVDHLYTSPDASNLLAWRLGNLSYFLIFIFYCTRLNFQVQLANMALASLAL